MKITEVGCGTWAIGGPWKVGWGEQDDKDSLNALHTAIDLGVNWIDTAPAYGWGHSEKIVGKAIKGKRDKVFIFTKCGLVKGKDGQPVNNLKPKNIKNEVEESLRRLDIDYIDLYQFHWPDPDTDIEESWETMQELIKEGKIRYAGLSNHDYRLMEKAIKIAPITSNQPIYNMINRTSEEKVFPFTSQHGIGTIVYSPMASGFLTKKFDKKKLPDDDWRKTSSWAEEPTYTYIRGLVDEMENIAEKYEKKPANLSVAWVLMNPNVTGAIVGVRNEYQAGEMIKGAGWKLTPEEMNKLDKLMKKI
jgi:aryl-alcohol dehydrogenase-like predicted oxidoreductase